MPIYEYECGGCHETIEVLLRRQDEKPECPDCGSEKLERLMSVPASPATASGGKQLPLASGESCGAPKCCGGGCAME